MTNNCKTVQSVQGIPRKSAAITLTNMDWCVAKRHVSRFQQDIFQASRNKDFKTVRKVKNLFFKSLYARFTAVLQVTSNQGKNTPGVDGKILITPDEKWELVESLRDLAKYHPDPVRIIYIPKKNGSKRKLFLPTIKDRAMQALLYLTMIPEWEAHSENKKEILVGFCTTPNEKVAKKIAHHIVKNKLASCANMISTLTSIYQWKGKIEEGTEVLMIIKTQPNLKERLTEEILKLHPYDVPEIIFTSFNGGNSDYIQWVYDETSSKSI